MRLAWITVAVLVLSACAQDGCGPRPERFPLCSDCHDPCTPGGCNDCTFCENGTWVVRTVGLCIIDSGTAADANR
jgi:hypothetical protein